jgi:transposase
MYASALARQLEELVKAVRELDEKIAELTRRHPDEPIFRSLPGAGDALVPRLIAAFGSDRDRFDSAEQLQCYSGIAPVSRESGKLRLVVSRMACPKFLKQTFHEFADHARKWSSWSRACYQQKRAAGCKHHAAVRALAYKWIRIMFHLWKTGKTYHEKLYIEQLKQRGSKVVNFFETT